VIRQALRRGALIALVLVAMQGVAVAGDKEAMDAYKQGVASIEGGRYKEGIAQMESALQARGQEGSFRIGTVTFEYLPSRHIAAAWMGLGDAAKARQALDRAESVKGASRADKAAMAALRQRIDASNPAPAAATAAPATAPPAATAPVTKAPCPDVADASSALKSGDLARARRLAAGCLAGGEDEGARRVMAAVDAEMSGLLTRARREKASGDTAQAAATIAKVLEIDPANNDALDLRDQLPSAGATAPPRTTVAAGTAPRGASMTAPPAATAAVALEPGIRAFFEGNIAAAVASLEPRVESTTRPDMLTVYACALATQSLVEGDSGQADQLAAEAREAWKRAKALRPGLRLDPASFSPRVRELLGP